MGATDGKKGSVPKVDGEKTIEQGKEKKVKFKLVITVQPKSNGEFKITKIRVNGINFRSGAGQGTVA